MTRPRHDYRREAHEWRTRHEDGPLSQEERTSFEAWMAEDPLHAAAYAEVEIIWKALGDVPIAEAAAQITEDTPPKPSGRLSARLKTLFRTPFFGIASAACFALVLGIAALALFSESPAPAVQEQRLAETYSTARGEIRTVSLSDGSVVTLGPLTTIETAFWNDTRDVVLRSGNAFFDVREIAGSTFTVAAGGARIVVTGTAFDAKLHDEKLGVSVVDGEVRVLHALVIGRDEGPGEWTPDPGRMQQSVILGRGESVSVTRAKGVGEKRTTSVDGIGAWRKGRLVYVDAELGDIVADLNGYARSPIEIAPDARGLILSGTFPADDVEGTLDIFEAALPVSVVRSSTALRIEMKE